MAHIGGAHLRRQGYQRRTIVERLTIGDMLRFETEEIALDDLQAAMPVQRKRPARLHRWLHAKRGEELLHRPGRQFHTQHPIALLRQPDEVEALAAQRHQHARSWLDAQSRPVAG
ncbi:hypothetical protein D9M68_986020 [compost metagenome]